MHERPDLQGQRQSLASQLKNSFKELLRKSDSDTCSNLVKCHHKCNNVEESYECSCRDGYLLALDGHSCEDIDECDLSTHNCGDGAVCENTRKESN